MTHNTVVYCRQTYCIVRTYLHMYVCMYVITNSAVEEYGGGGGCLAIAPLFMASEPDEGEWPFSRPCRFTPVQSAHGTHLIGGWVGPKVDLVSVEKRETSFPLPGI
jgi:hypothetical protein